MASGNTLCVFLPMQGEPGTASYPGFTLRNSHPSIAFDETAVEYINFSDIMPRNYGSAGITAYIHWTGGTATSGVCRWSIAFERIGNEQQDIDSNSFGTAKTVDADTPNVSGNVSIDSISFTNSEIDGVATGELFRIQLTRVASHANDTMGGDAQVLGIELKEM